ncbi:transcriptional regulator [Capsulimonas corticalis]|uniref:Transcriptional regulator n=1 Tax=Capsulimonas corticalis TaxID=2219043 RepID=A0A402D0R7_9BACT|nr:AraC family transcriptional regulator [Capsulimonas corticalis]BDI33503.1 transcriptional regulator [Capsulimonas corticalis]
MTPPLTPQEELAALIERFTNGDGAFPTAIGPLSLYRLSEPSLPVSGAFRPVSGLFQPSLCVVAQGRKRVTLADETYVYDTAHCLLMSVDLPLFAEVMEATPEKPCLSMRLDLDAGEIGALIVEADRKMGKAAASGRGVAVSPIDGSLLGAVVRLLRLLETPDDIPILAPMAIREIYYRLLRGEHGARLCQIALENSQTQRIARAIDWLGRHFDKPVHIDDIAREANMSPAGLHRHFKAVTAMSPLQYQKHLRLEAARRLMLREDLDAATAGLQVGYESPSQFSREYRRLYGAPPLRDLARLRGS